MRSRSPKRNSVLNPTWRHQLQSVAMPNRRHRGRNVLRALEAKGGDPCEKNVGVRQRARIDLRVVRAMEKGRAPECLNPGAQIFPERCSHHGPILLNKRPPFIPGRNLRPTSRRQNVACLHTTRMEASYSVTGGDARSFCWVPLARQGWAEFAADGRRPHGESNRLGVDVSTGAPSERMRFVIARRDGRRVRSWCKRHATCCRNDGWWLRAAVRLGGAPSASLVCAIFGNCRE